MASTRGVGSQLHWHTTKHQLSSPYCSKRVIQKSLFLTPPPSPPPTNEQTKTVRKHERRDRRDESKYGQSYSARPWLGGGEERGRGGGRGEGDTRHPPASIRRKIKTRNKETRTKAGLTQNRTSICTAAGTKNSNSNFMPKTFSASAGNNLSRPIDRPEIHLPLKHH